MKNFTRTLKLIPLLLLLFVQGVYGQLVNEGFDGTFPPSGWTIINAGSGNNWAKTTDVSYVISGTGSAYYAYNSTFAANAWLFTPGVSLTAGQIVDFSFKQSVASASFPENLKFTVGTSATVAAQTTTLLTLAGLTNITAVTRSGSFTAPSTATYYFAFNCYSAADEFYLMVDDALIALQAACPAPLASSATLITTTTAQANWNLTTGNFIVEYGPTSTFGTPGTGATAGNVNNTVVTVSNSNLASLSGLTPSTGYSYVIRQDCTGGGNGYSNNSSTITFTTASPPPSNDDCANASSMPALTVGGGASTITGTTVAATQSVAGCTGTADDDVWYTFSTPVGCTSIDISLTGISAVSGTSTDMVFQVYSACGGTSLLCSDPNTATLTVTPSTTYFIRVFTYLTTSRVNFTLNVNAPAMTWSSDASTQPASTASAGATDVQIFRLQVTTAGTNSPLQMQTINVDMATGTASNVTAARVYYTTSTTFSTTTLFGTASSITSTFSVNGTQTLASGSGNYFWLVYDVACTTTGTIDAAVTSYVYSSTSKTPGTTNPGTAITPAALTSYSTVANGNWNTPATWSCGVPPSGTTATITINHNVTLDVDATINASVTIASGKTLTVNTNTLNIGTAGTGTQSLTVNGTLLIGGGTLNVGTATGVTTSNFTVASGATFTLSSGTVNYGPSGGYSRSLASSGSFTISGGTFTVNGSASFSAGSFAMSAGNFNIDGNSGISGTTSVGSSTSLLAISISTVTISGGTILLVDPNINNSSTTSAFNYSASAPVVCSGGLFRLGDGVSTAAGNSTTPGFYLTPGGSTLANRFSFYDLEINGGSTSTRLTRNQWDLVVRNTLTITSGSTLSTNDDVWLAKDLVNNGTFINAGYYIIFGALNSTGVSTTSPTSNVNTITGNGVYNNATSGSTANTYALKIDNSSGTPVSLPSSLLSGVGTGSISNTLQLSTGKLNIGSTPLTLGISTSTLGTLTGGSSTAYIIGEFRRWNGATSGTTARIFPIGSSSSYQPCTINFTTAQAGAGVISALFTTGSPGTSGLPLVDGGVTCEAVSPTGYWTVERLSGSGGTYTIDVNASGFTGADGGPITQFANIRLLKATTAGPWINTDGTPAGPIGLSSLTRAGCITFSKFAVGGLATALPLELASFTGASTSTSNILHWETLSEKNVQWHIVERSVDGTHWSEIGRKAGQEDSHTSLKYELEDRTPPAKAYYRLRSVDTDGQENLSNTIVLTRKGEHFGITAAFPSPANDQVTVQFASLIEENVLIRFTDLHGRLVLEQRFDAQNGINEVPVQIGSLQAGVYLVSISNATTAAAPVRIVKE
ncbi:MAG: T9SS type A sorting domain-containing protein [Saprospiraceae bacterium]|nr:T9SS type A sorting domain-containing protein [Saprospiraceae bacterium]